MTMRKILRSSLSPDVRFRFSDKAEVQANRKEEKVNKGTHSADLRCLDDICSEQRDRNVCEVEIELHSGGYEERACQKLAILSTSHGKIEGGQPNENYRCDKNRNYAVHYLPQCGSRDA
jgi:hypothetical protein